VGFFGFLRAEEAVIEGNSAFDASQHLLFVDISVDNIAQLLFIKVSLRQTHVDMIIGHMGGKLCPVATTQQRECQDQGHCFSLRIANLGWACVWPSLGHAKH